MDLTGKRVHHRSFGDGVITEQKKTTIVVTFRDGAKMFSYPGCFQTYLKILDTDLKEDVQEVVSQHEHAETAERKQRINELQTSISSNRRQEKDKSVQIKPFASVADFCQAYRMALSAEISFIRMTGGKHILLQEGKRIGRDNGQFVYLLESEDELNYPEGTPVTIWKGQSQISGKILNCEAFSVYLISELDLGAEVEMLNISAEACYLLQSVSERLMDLSLEPSEIAQNLICNGLKEIDYRNSDIAKGQETAVRMSLEQPITFVWGPPGTGKTQTLAKIAWAHIDKGERVLMLSYSNVCNGVQREHNKKLNNGLPILHKVPPKRDYGRYFCIMAEKGGTSHGGLTEKLSPFFHAKKQEVNAYAVRQDTYKLNQRIRQMEFLSRYSIDTLAQLETYRQAKLGEIVQLTAERKSLYKTNPDSPRIQQVNTALKQLRQEERLCRKIAEHSIEVQQHLTEARRDRAEQQKQEQERARDRRPDITTR